MLEKIILPFQFVMHAGDGRLHLPNDLADREWSAEFDQKVDVIRHD